MNQAHPADAGSPGDPVVSRVFKAYDVRGLVPQEIDAALCRAVGNAFVCVVGAERIVVGHDMRPSSPELVEAFAQGAMAAGADVELVGLASTDQLYYASGAAGVPGAMFTASHNPAQYNGIKLCREHAAPVGSETGLDEIRDRVAAGEELVTQTPGQLTRRDVLADYAEHLRSLVEAPRRRLRVVVDAGNGMAGHTAPAVLGDLVDLVPLYFELDGTFPNHEANPIDAATLVDLQRAVLEEGADLGLAFDGDADRCFVVDERGRPVDPSILVALIADRELDRVPGASVIHNLITSRSVPELVLRRGGTPVRTRVGHSFIKATMARTDAVFGGEHSGHFYFRDFWRADSGMLAALHVLAALGEDDRPLSSLLAGYQHYVASGEINSTVSDQSATLDRIEQAWGTRDGVAVDHLDGLSVLHADWWFNVRASNTEPLLRLNVEAADHETMVSLRDQVLADIRSQD